MRITIPDQSAIAPANSWLRLVVGDGSELSTEEFCDVLYSQESSTEVKYVFSGLLGEDVTPSNLTPDVCSITNWPTVNQITTGNAKIKVSNGRCAVVKNLSFADFADYSYRVSGFATGSFAKFTWDEMQSRMDASSNTNLFSVGASRTQTAGIYNPACWIADYDLSGFCMATQAPGSAVWDTSTPCVLLTDRYALGVYHFQLAVGAKVRFASKTSPGTIIERTVIGKSQDWQPELWPGLSSFWAINHAIADRIIYVLDSAVPSSIKSYPILDTSAVGSTGMVLNGLPVDNPKSKWQGAYRAGKTYFTAWRGSFFWINQFRQAFLSSYSYRQALPVTVYDDPIDFDVYGELIPYDRDDINNVATLYFAAGIENDYPQHNGGGAQNGDSGSLVGVPLGGSDFAIFGMLTFPNGTFTLGAGILNALIIGARLNAISNGHAAPPLHTVTVAPDPTL